MGDAGSYAPQAIGGRAGKQKSESRLSIAYHPIIVSKADGFMPNPTFQKRRLNRGRGIICAAGNSQRGNIKGRVETKNFFLQQHRQGDEQRIKI